jgi:SAM-dependent methyltransferase
LSDRYVAIDDEGYWAFDGKRVDDENLGRTMLENMKLDSEGRLVTSLNGNEAFVEYFDAPLMARHVRLAAGGKGEIDLPYGTVMSFAFTSLSLDEWDRIHGANEAGVPFVLTRQAQVEFFDLLEKFDDESVTIAGTRYPLPSWLQPSAEPDQPGFWGDLYKSGETGWDMGQAHPALAAVLPQLKMSKSRILVLGAGAGHDAAFLARAGHLVTAVDFSEDAVKKAQEKYGNIETLNFVRADAFNLPERWNGEFDLVFEHTCYCAISPDKRDQLINVWRRVLQPAGHLLAIFFAYEKRQGPPFGGSEWELRERLKKNFSFLYWTRWHHSAERRKGRELIVYARKKEI